MNNHILWQIPPSTTRWLKRIPSDQPVVVLMRHSVRDHLPPDEVGALLPITDMGHQLARALGTSLRGRLRTLHTSPLLRCVQTAEALSEGAEATLPLTRSRLLGDPGVYVVDPDRAWSNWKTLGHEGVMAQLVSASSALPGMAHPDAAARFLVQHMLTVAGDVPGVHLFVTHDSLVTATAARLLGKPLGPDAWPWYLEAAFFWRDGEGLHTAYRADYRLLDYALCRLDDIDVLDFARREIAATVGLDIEARFFLAGGAFKTLLTGHPPRDLDLWAPSAEDRDALVTALKARGARPLPSRPFADAFELADRVLEVPHKVTPTTLEARLARFDIALSAVGVEHRPGDTWSVLIHPLAKESAEHREVRLLKPLVNWKYALFTLERVRRYAAELEFAVPPEEEAEVWRVFEAQSEEGRAAMMARYARTGSGTIDLAEEEKCPLR